MEPVYILTEEQLLDVCFSVYKDTFENLVYDLRGAWPEEYKRSTMTQLIRNNLKKLNQTNNPPGA